MYTTSEFNALLTVNNIMKFVQTSIENLNDGDDNNDDDDVDEQ